MYNVKEKIKFLLRSIISKEKFYASDGVITHHNFGFIKNEKFKKAYNAGSNTKSWGNPKKNTIEWRLHTILWAIESTKNIDGDIVECGVNRGGFSSAINEFFDIRKNNKIHWLFDTFEGKFNEDILSKKELSEIKRKKYDYSDSFQFVINNFKENNNVKIVKGLLPESIKTQDITKISFLSLDLNSTKPEIETLSFLWNKISKGGIIVLDDYAYYGHNNQYVSMNALAQELSFNILSLPTGQGVVIKN
jgi:O-methyltransferase